MFVYNNIMMNEKTGLKSRCDYFDDIKKLIDSRSALCKEKRNMFITPKKLANNHEEYSDAFINMLGWPLTEYRYKDNRRYHKETVEELPFLKISRLSIETLDDFWSTGLIIEPVKKEKKNPFVIVAPGGGYKVEDLISHGDYDCAQYKNIAGKLVEAGVTVYLPTLLLWSDEEFNIEQPRDRQYFDSKLKSMGGSIAALEIYNIRCAIDYFIANEPINKNQIGMAGLSYGGFYTLYTSAAEQRIKSVFSSCFFSDRLSNVSGACRHDWLWKDSANMFFDAEVAALIAPRALYLENGVNDTLFPYNISEKEFLRLKPFYEEVGAQEKLMFYKGENGHEISQGNTGFEFFIKNLV